MRLFVDITAHGWGHLAQTAPVVTALRQLEPALEVTVRSGLDPRVIRERLGDVRHHPSDTDFGLAMQGPFSVDRQATLARYQAVHDVFDAHVESIAALIDGSAADIVFANVGYLAIAAARRAGVPVVACSSLNWSDLFRFYCSGLPGAEAIAERMDAAYRGADLFARLEPGMPMERFETRPITRPIARIGRRRRAEVAAAAGVAPDATLILCAFAGMLPPEPPPLLREPDGLTVLGPGAWASSGAIAADAMQIPFADLVASVDGVITKPGYGMVAELGCTAVPTLMVSRRDWPEEPHLLAWLSRHGRHVAVDDLAELSAPRVRQLLAGLAGSATRPAEPGGEADVVRLILAGARSR